MRSDEQRQCELSNTFCASAFLVYHWRGEHDFFYLTVREETVLGAGWWYAGE